jgi:hypothetical protein
LRYAKAVTINLLAKEIHKPSNNEGLDSSSAHASMNALDRLSKNVQAFHVLIPLWFGLTVLNKTFSFSILQASEHEVQRRIALKHQKTYPKLQQASNLRSLHQITPKNHVQISPTSPPQLLP